MADPLDFIDPTVGLVHFQKAYHSKFFSLIYVVLVPILAADDNQKSDGSKALGFSALRSSGLVIILMIISGVVVFQGHPDRVSKSENT